MHPVFVNSVVKRSDYIFENFAILLIFAISTSLAGCGGSGTRHDADTDSSQAPPSYHADNDIAMTLCSIADAIRVGEPLDTTWYNFEGILTDGQGHPLYTDLRGFPGEWDVDVLSPTSAVVRNLYLGDLLPEDLSNYIAAAMELTEADLVADTVYHDEDDTKIRVYDFDGGYIRIETRKGVAPNGIEGPLMRITASRDIPGLI